MAILTITIGNSDDKLTQEQWSEFWRETAVVVESHAPVVHGVFASLPTSKYQNACWLVDVGEIGFTSVFQARLAQLARKYQQDSIAVTIGSTIFVKAGS